MQIGQIALKKGGEGGLEDDDNKSQNQTVVVPSLANIDIDETASGKDDVGKDRGGEARNGKEKLKRLGGTH